MRRRFTICWALALWAPAASAQVEVVGPSFAALSVPDLAASSTWYTGIFGLETVFEAYAPDSSTHVVLLANTVVRIELVWHKGARSRDAIAGAPTAPDMVFGPAKIGFVVADLDGTIATLKAHHATIEGTWLVRPGNLASTDTLWTRNIMARDNSGNYVQFFEKQPPAVHH